LWRSLVSQPENHCRNANQNGCLRALVTVPHHSLA
jgi:hypothetical protein